MECWHTFLFVKTFLFYRIESTPINIISDVKKKWSLWSKDTSLDCYLSVCFLSSCTHVCYILTKKKKSFEPHFTLYARFKMRERSYGHLARWGRTVLFYCRKACLGPNGLSTSGGSIRNFCVFGKCWAQQWYFDSPLFRI